MGKYQVKISKSVEKELSLIKRSGRKADIEKLNIFFLEISNDPRSGTGKPELYATMAVKYGVAVLTKRIDSCIRFLKVKF